MANDKIQFYNKSGRPNRFNLPDFIVRAFEYSPRDFDLKYIDASMGVTTLIDSPKIKLLRKRYKDRIKEDNDISNDSKMMFGTMAHLMIERSTQAYYADPEFANTPELIPISEKRIVINYPASELTSNLEFNVVMKVDLFYPENPALGNHPLRAYHDGAIWDLKTGTVWDYKYKAKFIAKVKAQIDMYKYGIEEHGFEGGKKHKVNRAYALLWMKDWQASGMDRDSNYPDNDMVVIEIPLDDNDTIRKRIKSKIVLHSVYQGDPQSYHCTTEERWSKQTEYAVYANPHGDRATKLFKDKMSDDENKADAVAFLDTLITKFPNAVIVERAGMHTRCVKNYCSVADFCNQYRSERGLPNIEEADKKGSGVTIVPVETKEEAPLLFQLPGQEVVKKEPDVKIDIKNAFSFNLKGNTNLFKQPDKTEEQKAVDKVIEEVKNETVVVDKSVETEDTVVKDVNSMTFTFKL